MRSSRPSFPSSPDGWNALLFWAMLLLLLAVTLGSKGCGGTKVLMPQSGAMVRAGPDVKGRVYHWDGSRWVLSANKLQIPEGWFIGAPPDG